jgi:hypothetical protein
MNRKITLILIGLALVITLAWFYATRETKVEGSWAALEKRLAEIPFTADSHLPHSMPMAGMIGTNVVRLKRSEINDSTVNNSVQYLNSLVIGLVRATYRWDISQRDTSRKVFDLLVEVEIAQFASSNDAYGFYSQLRPAGAPFDTLGTESYFLNDTLRFTKSNFVVTTSSNSDKDSYWDIKATARFIDNNIAERSVQPLYFRLFPYRDQLVPSQKYFSLNYLGVELLDEVYTVDYAIDEDTLTLFLTTDTSGEKFLLLTEWAEGIAELSAAPPEIEFPEGFSASIIHPLEGQIVAGLVNRKLVGVINYKRPTGNELMRKWILGLK